MKIKAAVLYKHNTPLSVEEIELDAPMAGEVLVKIAGSGVCHSDWRDIKGEWKDMWVTPPVVLGHEGAGIVEGVGPGVSSVKPGDHAVLSFVPNCGTCYYCVIGSPHLCDNPWEYVGGSRLHKDSQMINHYAGVSSFAEYAVVPEAGVIAIPSDVPLDKAALVGCCVTTGVGAAINTAKVAPGSTVAVFGTGGVGLNVVQGALLAGAETIIAVDIRDNKLGYAKQFGATHTVNSTKEDPVKAIKEITQGKGTDYSFEAIGNPETIVQALSSVRKGGTAIIVGQAPYDAMINFPARLLFEEARLVGCLYGSARMRVDMPHIIDLYMQGKLKVDELVTRTYTLDEINAAFQALDKGEVARSVITF